ncbi:MAG: hypothetical protein Q7R97_04895 [Candidatus Daviesbacteria bacterium]|nr:hypothetical protein [Candidatus Daviesbacteria bacterium]
MNSVTLQVPINKSVRDQATLRVEKMGFSSLQEIIRLFINKIAVGEVNLKFEEAIQLSPKAIKRYDKMIDEIESGKAKLTTFTNVSDLMKHLNEN